MTPLNGPPHKSLVAWFILVGFTVMIVYQLRSGMISSRGGGIIKRERNPRGFWLLIAFEIAGTAMLLVGLILSLAGFFN
jgi:hypothetical protein